MLFVSVFQGEIIYIPPGVFLSFAFPSFAVPVHCLLSTFASITLCVNNFIIGAGFSLPSPVILTSFFNYNLLMRASIFSWENFRSDPCV